MFAKNEIDVASREPFQLQENYLPSSIEIDDQSLQFYDQGVSGASEASKCINLKADSLASLQLSNKSAAAQIFPEFFALWTSFTYDI